MRSFLLAGLLLVGVTALAADTPTVYTVATSHLDTQWRWTVQTTIDEYLLRTLDDNFDLLERYPDYVFNFEGAFRYQLMKEYYPERYERLKEYIAQDRWRVCGSWLDAVDVNMPSPEALFRHALYGNGWFDREFGKRSVDVFLPDCFGFGHALPSVMAHSGLTGFSTQKLTWGSAYGTPFDLGRWRGVDGREVVAAVNPGAYVSDLEGDVSRDSTVLAAVERTVAAGGPPLAFKYYGTGDTGGAPDEQSVQWLERSLASDGPVRVIAAGADQIFRELEPEQIAALPVYDGELVMTSHGAGCYTSQAAMKRWNRRCEVLADAAERAATLAWWLGGQDYPHAELERAWTRFLWHGFHDDLTGTSIPEAYAFSWNDMLLSQQEFAQILETAMGTVARALDTKDTSRPMVVLNPLGFAREDVVVGLAAPPIDGEWQVHGPDGQPVPTQILTRRTETATGLKLMTPQVVFRAAVPANGVAVFDLRQAAATAAEPAAATWDPRTGVLENDHYRLRLGEQGLLSLLDRRTGRELLSRPPRLQLLHDEPANWAAWEIDHDDIMAAPYAEVPLGGVPASVEIGPVLARLTFVHEAAGSVFRQTLTVAGDRVDWDLDIDWATRATLLKAAFFTTARDTQATYDLGLGVIARGLNRPLLYEVPAQRWADVTDRSGEYGLTVTNDGRHGWDRPDAETLRLTLVHTPAVNANWRWVDDQKSQDLGRHRVTIGMVGHGPLRYPEVSRLADRLNQPPLAFATDRHEGAWGRRLSLLQLGDDQGPDHAAVAVRAVKKSEEGDWLVVRLQELSGEPVDRVIAAPLAPAVEWRELRADEVQITAAADVDLQGGALTCRLDPFQPRTFALKLAPPTPERGLAPARSLPLDLPWNLDGLSTDEDPTDGDLDGADHTLPAAVIPDTLVRDGVAFRTGPREPGAANLLRCAGQQLVLPRSDLDRLQILICALAPPREAAFTVGASPHTAWIPDGRAPFGQWDSRLVGEDVVHEAADLIPAYTTEADLGWVATHRRDAAGRREPYVFTHFYRISLPVNTAGATVSLPDDPDLVILAASLADSRATAPALTPLVDRPQRPSLRLDVARRAFVDTVSVRLSSPNRGASLRVGTAGGALAPYDGAPIVLTESTTLVMTAAAPGYLEETARQAVFTRLEPWPAGTPGPLAAGLEARCYLGAWEALPDWPTLEVARTVVNAQVTIPDGLPDEDIGVVLEGWLDASARGVYRFWLTSDDGSRLLIGDQVVVDHDGLHGASAVWGDAPLAAGRHRLRVEFFQHLGGRDLKLEWSGPGFGREIVPAAALSH